MEQDINLRPGPGRAAEETVWTGSASQVQNFWVFFSCLLVIPIPWAFWRCLQVRCRVFRLTTERLLITHGVLNKETETLELYRIRDLRVTQPFWLRLFGLQNIHLVTTDTTTPEVALDYVPASQGLPDHLRRNIEACRVAKGVREIDME